MTRQGRFLVEASVGLLGNTAGTSDAHFRKTHIPSVRPATCREHFRSHSGHNAGAALAYVRTAPEYVIPPHLFRTLLLERLQLPLQIEETRCNGCPSPLDPLERHRAACPRTGRLRKTGHSNRTRSGHSLPRGRCESQVQRILAGHEHWSRSNGREAHRAARTRFALFRESSTRRGRHAQTCPDAHWRTSPARSRRGWGRPGAGTSRQRNHVPIDDQFSKMPVGGHGD